ncbi:hypothetical protein ACS77_06190 [Pseudomonas syringae]|uniref:Uncharacterized protein n=1 Tax=Pseudomonas syringae TaxID=317 RepID=A0A0L1MKS2_PSESX|nr:hypothetical protein ACS77_06190 [Pseudomonas syringae]
MDDAVHLTENAFYPLKWKMSVFLKQIKSVDTKYHSGLLFCDKRRMCDGGLAEYLSELFVSFSQEESRDHLMIQSIRQKSSEQKYDPLRFIK